jgi:hypothetical protein
MPASDQVATRAALAASSNSILLKSRMTGPSTLTKRAALARSASRATSTEPMAEITVASESRRSDHDLAVRRSRGLIKSDVLEHQLSLSGVAPAPEMPMVRHISPT